MLKVENLKKSYQINKNVSEDVLKNINITFEAGEITAIYGASGCGKSTLLNIISGLDSEYEGKVSYNGKDLKTVSLDSYRKNNIGFIFQNFNLFSNTTVFENVKTVLDMFPYTEKEKKERIQKIIEQLGIKDQLHQKIENLSGGQKQRVAIARALVTNPDIIVADEPTGALDETNRDSVLNILKEEAAKGKMVIIVTHDKIVSEHADTVIQLNYGNVASLLRKKEKTTPVLPSQKTKKETTHTLGLKTIGKKAYINLKSRKLRTLLVSIGTSIGIAAVLIGFSLGTGTQQQITTTLESIENPKAVNIENKHYDIISNEELKKIKTKVGTSYTYEPETGAVVHSAAIEDGDFFSRISSDRANKISSRNILVYGDTAKSGKKQIYISLKYAKALLQEQGIDDPQEKDFKNLINTSFEVSVDLPRKDGQNEKVKTDFEVAGIVNGVLHSSYIPEDTFDSLYKDASEIGATGYSIETDSTEKAEEVKAKITKDELVDNSVYNVRTFKDTLGPVSQIIEVVSLILTAIAGISLFVSAFMILIVIYTSVIERTKEIGILRALGYQKKSVRTLFFIESLGLVMLSNIIGVCVSIIVSYGLNMYANAYMKGFEPSVLSMKAFGLTLLITISIGLFSAIYPAYKAARIDPIQAIRYE